MYYEDDIFHPSNDDDDIFTIDSISVNTFKSGGHKSKHHLEDAKKDKGYYSFDTKVGDKRIKIVAFDSGFVIGNKIRDPVSGMRQNYLIGSADEDLFFKVRVSSQGKRDTPITLFYDSPEHFERHQKTTIGDDIKQKWNRKRNIATISSSLELNPENTIIK
jgi:hypothetical protein